MFRSRSGYSVAGILALVWLTASVGVLAQTSQGIISGAITDTSGAVVSGAVVAATNLATGEKRTTVSDSEGYYLFPNVPVGTYKVTAILAGFETSERTQVAVSTAATTEVKLVLKPGSTTQVVTVSGASALLQTTSTQMATVIQASAMTDLPLNLGSGGAYTSGRREIDMFLTLTPGVQEGGVAGTPFAKSFNGSQTFAQELIIDGGVASGASTPGLLRGFAPPFEAVEEFNVQLTNYPAEYPLGFGIQNFTLKSGTNQLHGDAFEFVRNTVLDARSFFSTSSPINKQVPVTKQNEFGGTLGGPFYLPKIYDGRDKTFFHFAYTGFELRGGAPSSSYVTMPTAQMLQGDFSQLVPSGNLIYDPATTAPDGNGGFTRTQFPGNIIPNLSSRLDPAAKAALQYFPTPDLNQPFNNFLNRSASPTHDHALSFKVDENITPRHKVTFSYYWDNTSEGDHYDVPGPLDGGWQIGLQGGSFRVNYNFLIKSNLVNSLVVGTTNNTTNRALYSTVGDSVLNIPNLPSSPGLPCMSFSNLTAGTLGDGCDGPLHEVVRQSQIRDTLSWIKGKHQFKFGADIRRGTVVENAPAGVAGSWSFSNLETSLPDSTTPGSLGNGFASFLLGQVDSASQTVGAAVLGYHTMFYSGFAQDDYRITPKLTLNIGAALERATPLTESHYRLSSLALDTADAGAGGLPGALEFSGFGPGRINRPTFLSGATNVSPRLGLAYAVSNKTVLRAGYAMYFSGGNELIIEGTDAGAFITGFQFPQSIASTNNGVTPGGIFSSGFPTFTKPLPDLDPTLGNNQTVDYMNWAGNKAPRLDNWTFDVQHEFGGHILLDVAYVGQQEYDLSGNLENLNQVNSKYLSLGSLLTQSATSPAAVTAGIRLPYPGFTGSVAQSLKPFPQYLSINDRGQPTGRSSYDGLQAKLQKRFSAGYSILASYTLSKTLANNALTLGQPYATAMPLALDTDNRGLEKALAPINETNNLAISYTYQLPFGPRRHFANGRGPVGKVVGGWETSGNLLYYTGVPIPVTGGPSLPLGGGSNRPNLLLGEPVRASISGRFDPHADRYLNLGAFSQPAPYTIGTVGPTLSNVRGFPGANENLSLIKNTYITESTYVQFRAEAYNVFNRVIFSNPAANINTPATFGQVTGQANTPREFQFALKLVF
jgi:hypothetical protein